MDRTIFFDEGWKLGDSLFTVGRVQYFEVEVFREVLEVFLACILRCTETHPREVFVQASIPLFFRLKSKLVFCSWDGIAKCDTHNDGKLRSEVALDHSEIARVGRR